MAADKTSKRKRKTSTEAASGEPEEVGLRQQKDPRSERRYEPKPSVAGLVTIAGAAVGALLAGAGTYAQWFRGDALGPFKLAPYLLAAGAALMIAVAVFGSMGAKPVRVGDAGVAVEKDASEIERIPWYEVSRVALTTNALAVHSSGTFITIPRAAHAQAVARIVAEAKQRVPNVAEDLKSAGLERLDDSIGQVVTLEPPQAAGQRCKSSDKIIAFERDARFCGRCGEIYHKDSAPRRCLTCDAALRAAGSKS